jgi:16S rRNA pseudouridine516 synthase
MAATRQRIDKVLAHILIASRKEIKDMIKSRRIEVNGIPAQDAGLHVNPFVDAIVVDGEEVHYREFIYLMLNKPQGVISATEDKVSDVVLDLLAPEHQVFDPFPVGRLDKDTEGFLLLTNDGQLAHQLLSPKKHVPKTYYAKILGRVTNEDVLKFAEGIILEDGYQSLPGELRIIEQAASSQIELTIYEGKFHQVKRMFEAVGKEVTFLKRIQMGSLPLDESLAPGEYRELTESELESLRTKE